MTATISREFELSAVQREAVTEELFARWQAAEPDRFHCFCGSHADLVDAVNHSRERAAHDRDRGAALERAEQRQRDHNEIGS